MVENVEQFAEEVKQFSAWVLSGGDSGQTAAREALVRITRLYLMALSLPGPWSKDLDSGVTADPTAFERWQALHASLGVRLPFQYYGTVFNPLPVPAEESIVGDLADDIADIFGDVNRGLRLFESGNQAEAIWVWRFYLEQHWGKHATSAIRALHCYLAAESPEKLTIPREHR